MQMLMTSHRKLFLLLKRHASIIFPAVGIAFVLTACHTGIFGRISGVVIEGEVSRPLADVKLTIDGTNFIAITNTSGQFKFEHVPVGNYTITCSNPGFQYREISVNHIAVNADTTTPLTLVAEYRSDAVHESKKDTVRLSSLKTGWLLCKGTVGNEPPKVFTHLIAVHNDDKRVVSRLVGLKGNVHIDSASSALEFVRLFTNLPTYYFFKDPNRDHLFIEVTPSKAKPSYGEMPQEQFTKLGVMPPVVTSDENYFYIKRFVVSLENSLYKVTERVSFDGEYTIMNMSLILPHMDIPLPSQPK